MTGKTRYMRATYLFARPSFLTGIARLIDPFGILNTYNTSSSDWSADFKALYSDWKAVGEDLEFALQKYAEESAGSQYGR